MTLSEWLEERAFIKPTIRVNSLEMPSEAVRERLLKLDCSHVLFALKGVWEVESEGVAIANMPAYLLTALYNSLEMSE